MFGGFPDLLHAYHSLQLPNLTFLTITLAAAKGSIPVSIALSLSSFKDHRVFKNDFHL